MIKRAPRAQQFHVTNMDTMNLQMAPELCGVYWYLLSRPDDWQVQPMQLKAHFGCSKDKIYRILSALVKLNLVERKEVRTDGKFQEYDYIVHEPHPDTPDAMQPFKNAPCPENQDTVVEGNSTSEPSESPCPENQDTVEAAKNGPCPEKPYPVFPYPGFQEVPNTDLPNISQDEFVPNEKTTTRMKINGITWDQAMLDKFRTFLDDKLASGARVYPQTEFISFCQRERRYRERTAGQDRKPVNESPGSERRRQEDDKYILDTPLSASEQMRRMGLNQ